MLLEADLITKRATLRWLAQRHPHWTRHELAAVVGMSRSWVSKWLHLYWLLRTSVLEKQDTRRT
jgi:hypothetical protein